VAHHTACRLCTCRGPTRLIETRAAMRSVKSRREALPSFWKSHTRSASRHAWLHPSLRQIVAAPPRFLYENSCLVPTLVALPSRYIHPRHPFTSLARLSPSFTLSSALTDTVALTWTLQEALNFLRATSRPFRQSRSPSTNVSRLLEASMEASTLIP